ncbi:phage tail tape measure protein [Metabacillus bambusae]|uniref:Phage tail tape measure protein n=1 Tax=Metabacillus bambusae TaxID=2795218 RepID=A0ABS3N5F4_9BACI|nr:phage tail tape measure protein [Metabacillus bambusae]MBO1513265.1 phage tail tape measure protein [Metabacillus bambusae]
MTEKIEGLSIGLDLDTLKLNSGLTDLRSKMRLANSEMKANLSAFDRGDKSISKYQTTLDGLNKKIEVQRAITEKAQKTFQKAVKEYGEGSKEAEKAANAYNNQSASLQSLQRYINRTTDELEDLRKEQKRSESGWTTFKNAAEDAGSTLTGIGERMQGVGQTLTASLTAPLAGFSVMAGKMALDFDASQSKMQASLGLTAKEAGKLSETAKILWEEGFGENVDEISQTMTKVEQNMGALSWATQEELKEIGKSASILFETFEADVNDSTKSANMLMMQFGLSSKEAFDMLTWGFQNGLDYSGEFLDTVNEYSPQFAAMGMSAEEMFSIFEQGAVNGAFSMDKVGDSVKEFNIRIKDGSKTTSDAMGQLSKETQKIWKSFLEGKKTGAEVMDAIVDELAGMDDQVKANQIGVGVFGTTFEDLEADAIYALGNMTGELVGVEDATSKAGDALQDNFGTRATKLWRDFLMDLEPVGDVLLDFAEDVLPKVADTVGDVTETFANLSPEGQRTTLIIGGVAAAIGPLLMGLGATVATLGPLIGSIDGLSGALTLLTGPVGLTVGALAGLGLGFITLDKEMDKPIIKSDIFEGKISENTQKIIGSYTKLKDEASLALSQMTWSQEEITQKHVDNMVAKYREMTDRILLQMDDRNTKEKEKMMKHFAESDALSTEEEAKILAGMDANYNKKKEKVLNQNEEQSKILQDSYDKHGVITQEASNKLNAIEQQKYETMISASVKNKSEQETILRNLKNQSEILTTEKAAKVVANSKKETNETVKEANKQYQGIVNWAKYQRDVTGNIKAEEARKIIKEAENQKNETVAKAEDTHIQVVKEAQKQAGEHASQVNWETGQVLSGWDTMYNGVLGAINWIRGLFNKEPLKKKGSVQENSRQRMKRQNAKFSYAKGTTSSGHPGGPAIVGEEGEELAYIPGKGVTLLGTSGAEYHSNLPRGTSVLPNKHTENLLKSYGFPGYEDGIGSFFDVFLKGSSNVWDLMKDKFSLSDSVLPSWLNKHTGSPLSNIGNMAKGWIKGLWDNWFGDASNISGSTGSGVQRWAGLARQALMIEGQYSKANLDRLLYQMQTESGGNPRAINLWDINAKRGTPSMGLLQTIMPTYQAYKHPQFDKGPYDPMSNILASIRYAMARYGSLARAYRGVGYETGAYVEDDGLYRLAEGGWPEWVIPEDPARRTDAMKLLALAGKRITGNKRPNQLHNVGGNSESNDSLLQAVLEQNRILMALLQSSQNIERKPIISEGDIGRAAERYDSGQSSKHAIFNGRVAF